ncbi:MAG: extracellular solute-binding protein [Lachnospiraceae bacterium]
MKKRAITMLLCGVLAVSALAGCGGSGGNAQEQNGEKPAAKQEAVAEQTEENAGEPAAGDGEVIEVTCVLQLNPEISLENNPVLQKIEEETGVRLIVEAPPSNSFSDRVKILVGTGDMPDFFAFGADVFATQWAEEGLLLDVTDLIGDYPNLSSNISAEQYGDTKLLDDGRIYGIPRPNSYDKHGFLINKKWLDAVGMDAPKTVEEFVEVCRAFTTQDPDGNGVDDTYGASFGAQQSSLDSGIWHLNNDFLSTAYHISAWHHGMPDADGSFTLRPLKSKYYDYVTLVRDLYAEGIIDREFITHKAEEHIEKFAQGRVGIVGASGKNFTTNVLEKYSLNPDDYLYCAPLVLEESQDPVYVMPPSNWMAYFINAESDKVDAVLRVLDWANSEEGFITMQLGLEGKHYNSYDIETRAIDRTEEQTEAVRKVTSNMFAFANAYQNQEALMGGSTPVMIEKWQKEAGAADEVTKECFTPFVKMLDKIAVEFPDDAQAVNNMEVRYVTGEAELEELKDVIENDYAPKTADILKEFQDYMAKNPVRFE